MNQPQSTILGVLEPVMVAEKSVWSSSHTEIYYAFVHKRGEKITLRYAVPAKINDVYQVAPQKAGSDTNDRYYLSTYVLLQQS